MRMLILAAALIAPTAAAADYKAPAKHCRDALHPADAPGRSAPKKLGELPPGQLVLTVYRQENGCPKPLIVRQNIGAQPRR